MRIEWRGGTRALLTVGLALVGSLSGAGALVAQAPLFLVNRDTRVGSLEFSFPEGRSLPIDRLGQETSLTDPGFLSAVQRRLTWLPLISAPTPIPFDPVELQKDVVRLRRLYSDMGFPAANISYEVQLDTVANAVDVNLIVLEGPPILLDTLTFGAAAGGDVSSELPPELVAEWRDLAGRLVGTARGRRFGAPDRQRLRSEPLRWAQNAGYPFASVQDQMQVDSAAARATLHVIVDVGARARVDSIIFEGNSSLSRNTLLRELPFRVGDLYSARRVNEGQRQIFGLDLVRLALADLPEEQPRDSTVTVRYRINEGRPRLVSGEGGYSSASGIRARADWTHRDFLGGAKSLTATLDARSSWLALEGNTDQSFGGSMSLREPYIFHRLISGSLSPFVEYRDGIIDRSWSYGIGASLLWEKGPLANFSLDYRLSRREILDIRAGFEVTEVVDFLDVLAALDSLESGVASSVLSFSTVHGRVDDPLDPDRGWILRTSTQVAGPSAISAVEYVRGQADVIGFFRLGRDVGLSLSAGAGLLHPFGVSAPTATSDTVAQLVRLRDAMLTAGGTQSVRGWGNGLLGPKLPNYRLIPSGDSLVVDADRYVPFAGLARITTSAEFRLPMPFSESDNGTFVFVDGGRVWNHDSRFGGGGPDPLGQERFFASTGAGLRFLTLVGAVRISVGYKLNPSLLDLRDPRSVAIAVLSDLPIESVPEQNIRRFHLHLSIGRGL